MDPLRLILQWIRPVIICDDSVKSAKLTAGGRCLTIPLGGEYSLRRTQAALTGAEFEIGPEWLYRVVEVVMLDRNWYGDKRAFPGLAICRYRRRRKPVCCEFCPAEITRRAPYVRLLEWCPWGVREDDCVRSGVPVWDWVRGSHYACSECVEDGTVRLEWCEPDRRWRSVKLREGVYFGT